MIPWRLYTALAACATFFALIFAVYYYHGAATKAERKAQDLQATADKATKIQTALDTVSGEYEALKADRARIGETRTNTIREIYRNVQVDPGCAPPPAIVSLLDNAIADANAASTRQPSK